MSASAAAILEVENLGFRYGDRRVLEHCSFSLPRGARLAIIGSSGSGKSTLLRLILGLARPVSGSIRFDGRDLVNLDGKELNAARRRIGMVHQSSALISSMTVRNNLALPLKELTDSDDAEIARRVEAKLSLVGMLDVSHRLPSELSGGMRKRISFARALVLEPEMILFDEPTSGLDPVNASLIDELIVGISGRTGTSVIVVTHNMASAFSIATSVAMLHEGRILESGVPDRLRRSRNPIVQQFVTGNPEGPLTQEPKHATTAR